MASKFVYHNVEKMPNMKFCDVNFPSMSPNWSPSEAVSIVIHIFKRDVSISHWKFKFLVMNQFSLFNGTLKKFSGVPTLGFLVRSKVFDQELEDTDCRWCLYIRFFRCP